MRRSCRWCWCSDCSRAGLVGRAPRIGRRRAAARALRLRPRAVFSRRRATARRTRAAKRLRRAAKSRTETGNEEDVCELGCEGAVEVAEGIVRCPDDRVNRIGGGTFDPTITAPSCVGNEDILDCTSDAQCSDGTNGRCIQDTTYLEGDSGDGDGDPGTICRCAYSCSSDADCEQGSICVPPAVSYSDWPICIPAGCQIGSECGECGECGMAASLQHVSCAGPVYAVECRTADDLCAGGCKLGTCFPAPNGQWQCHYIRQCF